MSYSQFGPVPLSPIMNHVRITLSSSQILALNSTPITIISAITGLVIVPLQFVYTMNYGGTAYVSAGSIGAYYAGNLSVFIAQPYGTFLTSTASNIAGARSLGNASAIANSNAVGNAVVIFVPTSNPTTGNSTIDVDCWYVTCAL